MCLRPWGLRLHLFPARPMQRRRLKACSYLMGPLPECWLFSPFLNSVRPEMADCGLDRVWVVASAKPQGRRYGLQVADPEVLIGDAIYGWALNKNRWFWQQRAAAGQSPLISLPSQRQLNG